MSDLTPGQWAGLALAAILIGLSKGGVAGLGVLVAAVAANVLPAKVASGFVLPLLVAGDLVGVRLFRRQANGRHLWRLMPWTVAGLVIGWFTLGRVDDSQAKQLVGALVVALIMGHLEARRRAARSDEPVTAPPEWLAPLAGLLAGFTTFVANAAGPVMIVYLLAMRVPKLEFLGTAAWFFCVLNLVKVPFMVQLGLVNTGSLWANAALVPLVVLGALAGRWLVRGLGQRRFELGAALLALLAGGKLLVF